MLTKNAAILSAGACLAIAVPQTNESAAVDQANEPFLTLRPDLSQDASAYETLELRETDGGTFLVVTSTQSRQQDSGSSHAPRESDGSPRDATHFERYIALGELAPAPTLDPRIAESPFTSCTLEYTPGNSVIFGGPENPLTLTWSPVSLLSTANDERPVNPITPE